MSEGASVSDPAPVRFFRGLLLVEGEGKDKRTTLCSVGPELDRPWSEVHCPPPLKPTEEEISPTIPASSEEELEEASLERDCVANHVVCGKCKTSPRLPADIIEETPAKKQKSQKGASSSSK